MLMAFSVAANVILFLGLVICLSHMNRYRENRKQRGLFRPWSVPKMKPGDWDSEFRPSFHGVGQHTEIRFVPEYGVRGGISDLESWILCNLAKRSKLIFEFGTCTGKTTYLLAANAPADAQVVTISLRPNDLDAYRSAPEDDRDAHRAVVKESVFTNFYYTGTAEEEKILQLFNDTKRFDETPYKNACDLVFVDASHGRSYVDSDSRKALRMVSSGGVVVWHDYRGPRRTKDVFHSLNALSRELPLVHLAQTSLVVFRKS
jgi:predicted O-methyltransferase YrrM